MYLVRYPYRQPWPKYIETKHPLPPSINVVLRYARFGFFSAARVNLTARISKNNIDGGGKGIFFLNFGFSRYLWPGLSECFEEKK